MNALTAMLQKLGPEMLRHTTEHLVLTFTAMLIAIGIAVPGGIYLTRTRWPQLASAILTVAAVVQTIPALALIAFIVLIFAMAGFATIGFLPGLVALVLYALLPLLRNTYTGIRQVDPAVIEVATGMGMTPRQILFRVQIPLSLPVIMAGVRIATVWTVGIATLCGLIGAGGLGELIFRGLRSLPRTADYLVAGTVPAALLAILADGLLGRLETWLTPGVDDSETSDMGGDES
jgi:osmoprotectant transport system permease protein